MKIAVNERVDQREARRCEGLGDDLRVNLLNLRDSGASA